MSGTIAAIVFQHQDHKTAIDPIAQSAAGVTGKEEAHIPSSSELTWVLDPIDDMRAFIAGMPL